METLTGRLLIASPAILDPNFRRTVVFVTAHTDDGAVGLVLNRPSEATVGEAVPQLAAVVDRDEPVFVGGPVNPNGVAMLAEFADPEDAGVVVEACRVDEQTVGGFLEVQLGHDGVVVGRARVAVLDRELLHECDWHQRLLSSRDTGILCREKGI